MERRGFLKGLFGGITSAGLLITAKPSDVEAFAAPLVKKEPLIIDSPPKPQRATVGAGQHLYNEHGECVAIIRSIEATRDVMMWDSWSGESGAMPGFLNIEINAIGIGTIQTGADGFPLLRGVKAR